MQRTSLLKVENNQVSQSSPYQGDNWPAKNAVNGINTFTHTNQGEGMWFKAYWEEAHLFTKIRIQNRNGCGDRLAKTQVFVSGTLVGSLPNSTRDNEWYEIYCNDRGNEVKLVTTQNTYLSIQNIEFYAEVNQKKENIA